MESEVRSKNPAAQAGVIIRNPAGDFYFKYRFLYPCGIKTSWSMVGRQYEINFNSGLEKYKHITNTRHVLWVVLIVGMLRGGRMWWEVNQCLHFSLLKWMPSHENGNPSRTGQFLQQFWISRNPVSATDRHLANGTLFCFGLQASKLMTITHLLLSQFDQF